MYSNRKRRGMLMDGWMDGWTVTRVLTVHLSYVSLCLFRPFLCLPIYHDRCFSKHDILDTDSPSVVVCPLSSRSRSRKGGDCTSTGGED